ncbi:MAG: hypothetical protein GYA24_12220 [Candidatus Lokiarchaeota archaeon]|nr:hypothetical protein [Candidatus Lokiarchaeota archaeon]
MNDFNNQLLASLKRQMESIDIYKKMCEKCGLSSPADIERTIESADWAALPAISDRMFKRSVGLFSKLKYNVPGLWHVSSSTSGDPSYVWRTEQDEKVIQESYASCYRKAKAGIDIMLGFAPGMSMLDRMSKRYDLADGTTTKVQSILPTLAAKEVAKKQYVDMIKINIPKTIWQTKVKKIPRPVLELKTKDLQAALTTAATSGLSIVFGASVIFIDQVLRSGASFPIAKDVLVLTGAGGWDGSKGALQAKPIDKPAFIENACKILGIPGSEAESRFWDNYGVTEKAFSCIGHWDAARKDYVYSTEGISPETKVIAVDLVTGDLVKNGKGVIRLISPFGNEGAATAIMQESDEITVLSTNKDGSIKEFMAIKRISVKDQAGEESVDKIGCAGHLGNVEIK